MKTKKLTSIVVILILLAAAASESTEKVAKKIADAAPTISNTRSASCLVKITADGDFLPLDYDTIDYLMHSSGVYGKAAREILDFQVDDDIDLFKIRISPHADRRTRSVTPSAQPARALRPPSRGGRGSSPRTSRGLKRPKKYADASVDEAQRLLKQMQRSEIRGFAMPQIQPLPSSNLRTTMFELTVDLSEVETKPLAEEFMNALTDNFRKTIEKAYHHDYIGELNHQLSFAESQRNEALSQLSEAKVLGPADIAAKKQLDEIVDLSGLTQEISFGEALEKLKNSVEPQLKVFVDWRDLEEYDVVYRGTEIYMDPIAAIPLGKALELLLKSISPELAYEIDNGVITIARLENLSASKQKLLLQTAHIGIPVEINPDQKHNMLRFKQNLEVDIAGIEARLSVIEERIGKIKKELLSKVEDDPINSQLQKMVDLQLERLENIKADAEPASAIADAEEKLARAKIEIAKRREEIAKSAGGNELARFNNQLTEIMIDLAEKQARLRVVSKQLEQTDEQLSKIAAFDPQASRIRAARLAFEIADNRFNELNVRISNLQPPTINILGGKWVTN